MALETLNGETPSLFVVDAMGFIFRSYHAIGRMTNPEGASTNALFGFVRSILKLIKDFSPSHLVVVYDGPGNSRSRRALYADYKANRKEAPLDLVPQFDWTKEFCTFKGIPILSLEGVEADDTMASIALWAESEGIHTYLCSSDKDLAQIVSPKISILNVFKENLILDPAGVESTYGIPPEKIGDYLSLIGDASDNIPGVPGIGPKGAQELIKSFGSVAGIADNLSDIKGKKGELLRANLETLLLSQKLVALDKGLPIPLSLQEYRVEGDNREGLRGLFQRHGFNSLLSEIEGPKRVERTGGKLIENLEELGALIERLSPLPSLALDTETTSEVPLLAEAVGIGLGTSPEETYYIPLNHTLERSLIIERLRPLLESVPLVGHNIKYDLHILHGLGLRPLPPAFDTMVASYLLHAEERQHGLDALSLKHFDYAKIPIESLIKRGKEATTMDKVPVEAVATYCTEDVEMTLRLAELFQRELQEKELLSLYETTELPLIPILTQMEECGIFLDREILASFGERVRSALKEFEEAIFRLAGETFNLNSPKQLSEILFDKLALLPPKKTKTGFSTNADVLESLEHKHPVIPLILEYRSLEKLRSTYIEALPQAIHPKTGRVHCTFNQSVAATGRLSCQDPNLQNIPIRTPLGREIRAAFRPQYPGWVYLSADYSQIELRLLAHLSQDPLLLEAFRSGGDVHRRTAAALFHLPLEEVTDEMRARAKAVNFGVIYGQQAFGLSKGLRINPKEAELFIKLYFEKYQGVKAYLERSKVEARERGFARTMGGRVRKIPEINHPNQQIRQAAERLAINTPLQGSQADLIKKAMIAIDKRMKQEGFRAMLLLQIHDELLFEVPEEEVEALSKAVQEEMEGTFTLSVPILVNLSIGKNWKEC